MSLRCLEGLPELITSHPARRGKMEFGVIELQRLNGCGMKMDESAASGVRIPQVAMTGTKYTHEPTILINPNNIQSTL